MGLRYPSSVNLKRSKDNTNYEKGFLRPRATLIFVATLLLKFCDQPTFKFKIKDSCSQALANNSVWAAYTLVSIFFE